MMAARQTCALLLILLVSSASSDAVASLREVWLASGGSPLKFAGNDPCNATDFSGVTCSNGWPSIIGWGYGEPRSNRGYLSPSIGDLTNLTQFTIQSTNLTGQLPSTLNRLTKLETLIIFSATLSGDLPDLSTTRLTVVNLYGNKLSGSLSNFPKSLVTLDITGNKFTDLSTFSGYPNTTFLSMGGNSFTGSFPSSIFWNLPNLLYLDVAGSQLSGFSAYSNSVPPKISSLYLSSNPLGPLPSWFNLLTGLRNLDLSYCNIKFLPTNLIGLNSIVLTGNQIGGDIGGIIRAMTPSVVSVINLSGNLLTGRLPDLSNFTSLTNLDISNNNLSGDLNVLTVLNQLYLLNASNAFMGSSDIRTIPTDLQKMSALTSLCLSGCNLTSALPKGIAQMTKLTQVYLNNNSLSGDWSILSNLTSLTTLDLSYNRFQGNFSSLVQWTSPIILIFDSAFGGSSEIRTLPGAGWTLPLVLSMSNCNLHSEWPMAGYRIIYYYTYSINLSNNRLNGSIPSLNSFISLNQLDLSNNLFTSIDDKALYFSPGYQQCKLQGNLFPCYTTPVINCNMGDIKCNVSNLLNQLYSRSLQLTVTEGVNLFNALGQDDQTSVAVSAVTSNLLPQNANFFINATDVSILTNTITNTTNKMSLSIEQTIAVDVPPSVVNQSKISLSLSNVAFNPFVTTDSQITVGNIVGVSIYNASGQLMHIENLQETINITIGLVSALDVSSFQCLWWNESQKGWSREGCTLFVNETKYAICQCIHLTNFTIGIFKTDTSSTGSERTTDNKADNHILIIACVVAGGVLVVAITALAIFIIIRRVKGHKGEDLLAMMTMNSEEGMRDRLKLLEIEYEEDGVQHWKAECDGISVVRVKKFASDQKNMQMMMREAANLKSLHHPEIEQYLGQDLHEGYLVTEWMNQRNLHQYAMVNGKIGLLFAVQIGENVAKGLSYIAEQRIIHTQINSRNVLLSTSGNSATAKISNFKYCAKEGEKAQKNNIGPHTAPEVIEGQVYDFPCDVYSFGLLMWTILFGEEVSHQMRSTMLKHNTAVDVNGDADTMLKGLVLDCTQTSPSDRPTFQDIAKKLSQRRSTMRSLPADHTPEHYTQTHQRDQASEPYSFVQM